jgi:hypothetical protein
MLYIGGTVTVTVTIKSYLTSSGTVTKTIKILNQFWDRNRITGNQIIRFPNPGTDST